MENKKIILVIVLIILMIAVAIEIYKLNSDNISNFEECVNAGNPVMESYPRQCSAGGKIFVENLSLEKKGEFQELKKGYYNKISEKKNIAIIDEKEWSELWNEMFPTEMITPIQLKENNQMIIAVFMGEKNSGGYSIEIERIADKGNFIEINVIETIPGEECIVTEALTQPYHIILTKKTEKNIKFKTEKRIMDC